MSVKCEGGEVRVWDVRVSGDCEGGEGGRGWEGVRCGFRLCE